MTTILGISGSLRAGSYNTLLLRAGAECTSRGVSLHVYEELHSIPLFNEDMEGVRLPPAVSALHRLVAASDGVLFATPEYNQSFPGVLKNAIDWISRAPQEVLSGKPVAVIGATVGQWGTRLAQSALRAVLHSAQAHVAPMPGLYVRTASGLFDARGRLADPDTRESLAQFIETFASFVDGVASQRLEAAVGNHDAKG